VEDKKPPADWPIQGNVEFHEYSVRYREGLDLVLKNITLNVKGGEKVGRGFFLTGKEQGFSCGAHNGSA